MATIATNPTAPFGSITALYLVNTVEKSFSIIKNWRLEQKTKKELSKLTSYQLEDIGLGANFASIIR